jgi:hypothetical protein
VRTVVTPRRIVGGALLVPLVLALGLIVHDLRNRRPRIEMALPGQTATASQAITEIPTRRDFRAAFPQRIAATLTQPPTTSAGSSAELTMVLREWTPSGKTAGDAPDCTRRSTPRVLISTDSGKLSRFLGWGCYSLEVSSQDQVGGVGRFSSVAYVLDARGMQAAGLPLGAEIPGREDMEAQFTLRLALNTDSAPSTADAAFAGNSTVAVLTRVPDEQTLIVRNPAAVLITATPPILRSNESRASGRAPSEADDSSDPDASDRSMRQGDETLQLELFRGAEILAQGQTASPTIRQVLQPGEYTVKVGRHKDSKSDAPIEHPVAVNVLSVRRPDPGPAVSSRNRPDLEWSIPDVLPASYDFDVPVRQTVAVEIPAVAGWTPFTASASRRIRYILDLRAIEKGEPSATALARVSTSTDRDQIVQREFDPGRYRCTVSAIGSAMADLVPMSPPRVTISFLGRGTGTAAAGK